MDLETISEILENILLLDRMTVPYAGNYGVYINSLLQGNCDKIFLNKLKFNIQRDIDALIPNCILENINFTLSESSKIQITLSIKMLKTEPVFYEIKYTI